MNYETAYEKYSLKPLRAVLLALAVAGDIAAVILFFSALAEPLLFAAVAALVVFDFILRRISLKIVYSYRYVLHGGRVEIYYEIIGKSRLVLTLEQGVKLTPAEENSAGKRLYGDDHAYLFSVKAGDKDYIVYADRYRLYILDRRGRERVNVPTLLNLSPETTLHLTRVNGRPVIALLDAEGYLLLVDFKGNVTSVPLDEAAPGGALNVADVNADGRDEFIVARGDRLLVHDARGSILYQYRWEGARLAYPYVYRFSAADIRVGVLDRGGHRLFLTAGEGLSKGFPVSGITPFSIAFFTEGDSGFYLFSGSEAAHLLKYRVQR